MEIGLAAIVEDCVGVPEPLQDLDVQGDILYGHVSRQSGVHPSLSEVNLDGVDLRQIFNKN